MMMLRGTGALADLGMVLLGEKEVTLVSGVPLNESATPLDECGELVRNLDSRPWPTGLALELPYAILQRQVDAGCEELI